MRGVDQLATEGRQSVAGVAMVGSRSEQQDSYRLNWIEEDKAWLLVVADGMGGHEGGAVASKIAVDGCTAAFYSRRKQKLGLQASLEASLEAANLLLADAQRDNIQLADMGTTLVAAHLSEVGLTWISVGDSPMWLLRDGRMLRLNDDHSLRGVAGVRSKNSNLLQSALTGHPIPLIDSQFEPIPLQPKDVLILASDGILTLPEKSIANIAAKHFPSSQGIAEALVGAVTEQGKRNQDNCTVVVGVGSKSGLQILSRKWLPGGVGLDRVVIAAGLISAGALAYGIYLWLAG
jgi:PPM family protein phosphatase